jgi:hypothetical protein
LFAEKSFQTCCTYSLEPSRRFCFVTLKRKKNKRKTKGINLYAFKELKKKKKKSYTQRKLTTSASSWRDEDIQCGHNGSYSPHIAHGIRDPLESQKEDCD